MTEVVDDEMNQSNDAVHEPRVRYLPAQSQPTVAVRCVLTLPMQLRVYCFVPTQQMVPPRCCLFNSIACDRVGFATGESVRLLSDPTS